MVPTVWYAANLRAEREPDVRSSVRSVLSLVPRPSAQRESWLVIDPKPFVGDPPYDATQHLLNCGARLLADPHGVIWRVSDLLGVDHERVRL
jgi:hypothetical protein